MEGVKIVQTESGVVRKDPPRMHVGGLREDTGERGGWEHGWRSGLGKGQLDPSSRLFAGVLVLVSEGE